MFFNESFKRSVYIASRTTNASGVSVYSTPIEYKVNFNIVLPTSASAGYNVVGTSYSNAAYVIGDKDYLSTVKLLDRVYVDVHPPVQTDVLASTADYTVDGILHSPTAIRLVLKKNVAANE